MLLKTEDTQIRHTALNEAEAHREQVKNFVLEELKDSVFLKDEDVNPTNAEKQLGAALKAEEVERRLKLLCPKLHFDVIVDINGIKTGKKMMEFLLPDGNKQKVMVYEDGLIPEHSVMQTVIKETLDPSVVGGSGFHIDRKDLTKHEIRPHEFDTEGRLTRMGDVTWDDTVPQVGMQRTELPWVEKIRGWRTMLAILIHAKYITIAQAEAQFGVSSRRSWAESTGRRTKTIPW